MNINGYKILIATASVLFLSYSCSTPKHITYFSDLHPGENELTLAVQSGIRVRPNDRLSILVNTQTPRLTSMFNLPILSQQIGIDRSSEISNGLSGYTIDPEGFIDFPVLGKIQIGGMTREEVATYIKEELQSNDLVKDPVVTVEFMNLNVAVVGEVNRPGRYKIDRDDLTILDALSQAGDLTIYGKRENVLVLRTENDIQRTYTVDLNSARQLYSSPVYYLQQNDVVYVEPNDTRARQSTVNGNNVRSTSFWISLASLLTTVFVLIK